MTHYDEHRQQHYDSLSDYEGPNMQIETDECIEITKDTKTEESTEIKALREELDQWGWWAQDDYRLGFSTGETSGGRRINITDDRAMELDRAIASFHKDDIKVMKLKFICNIEEHEIAKLIGIDEKGAFQLIGSLVMKVNDYLLSKLI